MTKVIKTLSDRNSVYLLWITKLRGADFPPPGVHLAPPYVPRKFTTLSTCHLVYMISWQRSTPQTDHQFLDFEWLFTLVLIHNCFQRKMEVLSLNEFIICSNNQFVIKFRPVLLISHFCQIWDLQGTSSLQASWLKSSLTPYYITGFKRQHTFKHMNYLYKANLP